MDLILWRHAEAEDGLGDLARKLTPKGRKQAKTVAAWLGKHLPDSCRVLVSPAARAQETAMALGREIQTLDALSPGVSVAALLAAANWPGVPEDCVLLVGHQPDLGALAAALLGAVGSLPVKKGAVWWFSSRSRAEGDGVILRAVAAPDMLF